MSTYTDDIDYGAIDDPADLEPERQPFVAGYAQSDARIFRSRLYADDGGVAQVIFRGTLDPDAIWVTEGSSGRLSVYAEVTPSDATDTVLQIAIVPTGKRAPARSGLNTFRLQGGRRQHAYLLDATEIQRPILPTDADDDDGQPTT